MWQEIRYLKGTAMTPEERADVIEECVRIALEKALKLEVSCIDPDRGSRLSPTAYQWRTIASEMRELAK